jgi:hypothetical protein
MVAILSHVQLKALAIFFGLVAAAPTGHTNTTSTISARSKSPWDNENTHISLINATPYRWRKTYQSSYQVQVWDKKWPEHIESGKAFTAFIRLPQSLDTRPDSAAEVTYELEGTKEPMSLQVQYRSGRVHNVYVEFQDNLQTLNNDKLTDHLLGFSRDQGGVGFLLAGTEGDFISNDGPLDWMVSQMDEIGHLPLREVALPRSHRAGQWKSTSYIGGAIGRTTRTQTLSLYDQLGNGGIRVLDVHPVYRDGKFYDTHGSWVGNTWEGIMGSSISDMVDTMNQFMEDHPGELFIWDIQCEDALDAEESFTLMGNETREKLYDELRRLNNRHVLPDRRDITTLPLSYFVNERNRRNGRSHVIVRVSALWERLNHFPGHGEGFVSALSMPTGSRWTNTNKVDRLVEHQIEGLREARKSRNAEIYNMDWILNQQGIQRIFPMSYESIVEMSGPAWRTLYQEFWEALTDETYPNWITLDDVHGSQHKAMAMAINKCLGARKCGDLGGKVTGPANDTLSGSVAENQ